MWPLALTKARTQLNTQLESISAWTHIYAHMHGPAWKHNCMGPHELTNSTSRAHNRMGPGGFTNAHADLNSQMHGSTWIHN